MKLNPDCIRDILLSVEEESDFNHETVYRRNDMRLKKLSEYSHEEVVYHIHQCELSGLIYGVDYMDGGVHIDIRDLTPKGHEFLANIRSDTVWKDVKIISSKVGSKSLSAITQIATAVITQIIKNQLGVV